MNPDQRPNGLPRPHQQPKPRPAPSLSPLERKVWLASHNAPKDMMLVAIQEFAQISGTLVRQQMALKANALLLREVARVVDESITNLQTLANLTDGGCDEKEAETAVTPIVMKTAEDLGNALALLRRSLPPKPQPQDPKEAPKTDAGPATS